MQNRFKSLISWSGVIAIFTIIVAVAGIKVEEITTWKILFDNLITIVSNPFILISIIVSVISFFNNPTDKSNY